MSLPTSSTASTPYLNRTTTLDPSCPFCAIGEAFPPPSPALAPPSPSPPNAPLTSPQTHIVAAGESVLAFLDVLPLTRCHVLVCPRRHVAKVSELTPGENAGVGAWMPVIARAVQKVSGVADFNVVQNNGVNAAQVVPHVHYHIIPRPDERQRAELATRAGAEAKRIWWKSPFGDGWRTDLDDEEGAELAAKLREEVYREIQSMEGDAAGRRERGFLLASL